MSMYVFLITQSGDRTNICSNIEVVNKLEVINYIKKNSKKSWGSQVRYAKLGSHAELLKYMPLDEFEEVFECANFTPEEITAYFRMEISEKYGLHKVRKETKRIPKKDLKVGQCYKDEKGVEWFYFGKVDWNFRKKKYGYYNTYGDINSLYEDEKQDGLYLYVKAFKNNSVEECFIDHVGSSAKKRYIKTYHTKLLKNQMKLVEAIDNRKIDPMPYEVYYSSEINEEELRIKFLDVCHQQK